MATYYKPVVLSDAEIDALEDAAPKFPKATIESALRAVASGKRFADIAKAHGCSTHNISAWISHARNRLMREVEQRELEPWEVEILGRRPIAAAAAPTPAPAPAPRRRSR